MFTSNFREYVMGVMKDASGNIFYNSSGFKVDTMPESKYYNLYEYGSNSSDYTRMILGDATGETASWYSAYRYFVASSNAWFYRGAVYTNAYANAFDFNFSNGGGNQYSGTRAVLISD